MISSSHELISFLGSPFADNSNTAVSFSSEKKLALYKLALKNKIGLFFLDKLNSLGELSPLDEYYSSDMERYIKTSETAIHLSSALSEITDDYAIFKFLKPYPHTPSDVDALIFSPKREYEKIVDRLLSNGYLKIGACPSQTVVYDLRGGLDTVDTRTVGGKSGGKYYIDLYNNVSASHLIYLNKESLIDYRIKVKLENGEIQTLHPIADLAVVLTHSIIPELLFTLGDYYTVLNYLRSMDRSEMNALLSLFKGNSLSLCAVHTFTMVACVHKNVHGFVPGPLSYLLEELGVVSGSLGSEVADVDLPFRYSLPVLVRVLAERMKDPKGFRSFLIQLACTANPRLAWWILYNIVLRRSRETY